VGWGGGGGGGGIVCISFKEIQNIFTFSWLTLMPSGRVIS
jgi:hypothetical protein